MFSTYVECITCYVNRSRNYGTTLALKNRTHLVEKTGVSVIYGCIASHPKMEWFKKTTTIYYCPWFCGLARLGWAVLLLHCRLGLPKTTLRFSDKDSQKSEKPLHSELTVYNSERIQLKISQGKRHTRQGPGESGHELPVVLSQWNCADRTYF